MWAKTHVTSYLEFSNNTASIPITFNWEKSGISVNHSNHIFELDYPYRKQMIHSYERQNITMLTEVSNIAYTTSMLNMQVGRGYIISGPAIVNAPIFSSYAPTLDHIAFNLNPIARWGFEFNLIRLDDRKSGTSSYNRWLYYRRLSISARKWKFGLKDIVLATGIQRGVEVNYLNPSAIFQLEQLHGHVEEGTPGKNNDNQLMGVDIQFSLSKDLNLYFDFILDEFQIDTQDRDRLQDVFGLTLGIQSLGQNHEIILEYYLASPWLYTNGGQYTNVEFYGTTLGFRNPHSQGFTVQYSINKPSWILFVQSTFSQRGDQSVATIWEPKDNKIPLYDFTNKWDNQLELKVTFPKSKYFNHVRITHDLLDTKGWYLLLGLTLLNIDWE